MFIEGSVVAIFFHFFFSRMRRNCSAAVIQAHWRGYRQRRNYTLLKRSALTIQSWWRYLVITRINSDTNKSNQVKAATIIQAYFRGYRLRKKLRRILSEINDEEMEEVEIAFDESLLSDECLRPLTPTDEIMDQFLSSYSNSYNCTVSTPVHEMIPSPHSHQIMSAPKFTLPGAVEEEEEVLTKGKSGLYSSKKDSNNGFNLAPGTNTVNVPTVEIPCKRGTALMDEWYSNNNTSYSVNVMVLLCTMIHVST